ncbi:hypothetical protein AVEN_220177-1, partial [Araneus ventricosus]
MQDELKSSFPEEQGERFHQDVRDIERLYQGRWGVNMLADYCWIFMRETEVEVVDYYSKFIEVQLISSLQATVVLPAIKSIFARHGIPLELISDGGQPFNSRDLDCFAKSWKFKHVKVSAKYPKSNGQVESTIQTVKQIFRKTLADSKDPYLALLLYRAALVLGCIYSPAELLMNRKLSTVLPSLSIHKEVQNESYYNYQKKLRDRRAMLKSYRRTLPELRPGSSVFVRNRVRQWEPAEVLRQNEIPRSYRIRTYNGDQINVL